MNMNDVLYAISLAFRRDHGDVNAFDHDSALPGTRLFVSTFKGLNKVDDTHLEIYLNYWHIDPTYIAATADFYPQIPWTASELSIDTVLHNHTRISEVTASTDGLENLDITKGASVGFMDRELSDANVTTATVPPGFGTGSPYAIAGSEGSARWAALQTWRAAKLHYMPSNGPYMLDTLSPALIAGHQVLLANDPNYPFTADHWASLVVPKIPTVTIGNIPQVVPGIKATVNVSATVAGAPYSNVDMNWLVINPSSGAALFQGTPTSTGTGTWKVDLNETQTGQLFPGAYSIRTITVGKEAVVPVITTKSFVVIPALAYYQALLETQLGLVRSDITQLRSDLNSANSQVTTASNTINGLTTLLYATVAIAVIAVIIAAVSVVMLMRRRPGGGGGSKGGSSKEPEEMDPGSGDL